jgi:hypothetical protein
MLDLRFKSLCLISFLIGCEKGVNIIKEYDKRSLYPMIFKWFYYLHSMAKFEVGFVDQITNAHFNLDIFEQTPSKSESTT